MSEAFVFIAGGGTGGHVFPGLAVAAALRQRRPELVPIWVGTAHGLEARLAPAHGLALETIRARGIVGKSAIDRLRGVRELLAGVFQSFGLLRRRRPRAVLGVGGYASAPVILAAALRGVPIVLHEQNAVPGWTNRLLAPMARQVAVSFPGTPLGGRRAEPVGNPVRADFFRVPPPTPANGRLSILVLGGSQGSRVLNTHVPGAFGHSLLADHELHVVHQAGEKERAAVEERYRGLAHPRLAVSVTGFLDDVPAQLAKCDLVIGRAGAGAVFEIAAAGRASILVPFGAAASSHQAANATALEALGAAVVIPEPELSSDRLAQELAPFAYDPPKIARFGEAARALARPDAAMRVADLVIGVMERAA